MTAGPGPGARSILTPGLIDGQENRNDKKTGWQLGLFWEQVAFSHLVWVIVKKMKMKVVHNEYN